MNPRNSLLYWWGKVYGAGGGGTAAEVTSISKWQSKFKFLDITNWINHTIGGYRAQR